jgi:diguanylate cyclase (GGDEF)-like protein
MSLVTTLHEEPHGNISPAFPSNRLRDLLLRYRGARHHDLSHLIDEALDVAAEAEQTIAIQTARIAELESLAVTDDLTGLRNRRGLEQALGEVLNLAARHGETGVLAFLDLDDFKAINDAHGHIAGDAVLRHTASLLIAHLRASDVVARLGGDEFAILLTRADAVVGTRRARELQNELNRTVVHWRNLDIWLRISMGTQAFGPGDDASNILLAADMAMYRDKRERRLLASAVK